MNLTPVLDLIAEPEATTGQTAARLREQITTLATPNSPASTPTWQTWPTWQPAPPWEPSPPSSADDPTIASAPYQQFLAVLGTAPTGMRAKDICLALAIEPSPETRRARHVNDVRAGVVALGLLAHR